jgi:hypothetical protein
MMRQFVIDGFNDDPVDLDGAYELPADLRMVRTIFTCTLVLATSNP